MITEYGLTIIIPIYNEKLAVTNTINQMSAIFDQATFPMEVLFVNDGSTDGTEKFLENLKNKNFRAIHHNQNSGYGAALKSGIKAAKYSYIAITDADATYPNDRIPEFFDCTIKKHLDMLVGARIGKNAKIPLIRRPAKWLLNKLANYLAGRKISDLNSGMRIMRKSVIFNFCNYSPKFSK